MRDDDRMPLLPGEKEEIRTVRFRTLGCYPLSGAVESDATTLPQIIKEMLLAKTSERQGRIIDKDEGGAGMEEKEATWLFLAVRFLLISLQHSLSRSFVIRHVASI